LRNAAALVPDKETNGSYGRFWGGPAPDTTVTAWQTNGGFALAFAAAALAPTGVPAIVDIWKSSRWVDDDVRDLPATLSFTGSAIALVGTIGQECCESGHASVFVDGVETFDQTGIWQNKSSSGAVIANSVLFTWRWPESGSHTLRFEPGATNAKEGGSFLHLSGYDLVP
jgi:hypothetical protein